MVELQHNKKVHTAAIKENTINTVDCLDPGVKEYVHEKICEIVNKIVGYLLSSK